MESAAHFPRQIDVRVEREAESAARECGALLAGAAGHVVLSGGSTPRRAYELAAELRSDWQGVELWWGDERCVPPEHKWSNYGLARRALLDRIERPPRAVHRIPGERGRDDAADAYDRELAGIGLDLVLLGLGADGHVASLFPHAPGLQERQRRAIGTEAGLEPFVDRVTVTIPVLESAALVVFLVVGAEKGDAARRAFVEEPDQGTPGSLVRSRNGRTIAILDRGAAEAAGIWTPRPDSYM